MKNYTIILLVLLSISSCRKDPHVHQTGPDLCAEPQISPLGDCITDSTHVKSLLYGGKWLWTKTVKGDRGALIQSFDSNPCTRGINYMYEFLPGGKVEIVAYGSYLLTGNYPVTSNFTFAETWTTEIVITDTATQAENADIFNGRGAVRICSNYLIIDNSPVDGPKTVFLRVDY